MTARIIDGKTIAAELRGRVADAAHRLARDRALVPGLAVVLVGNNPASEVYVGSKTKATVGSGMRSFDHRLPATVSETDLLTLVGRLNRDPVVHGILVQLPLPPHIDSQQGHRGDRPGQGRRRLAPGRISGRLAAGLPALASCTPLGCLILAKAVQPSLEGLEAVVIGRSSLVGKPLAQLLLAENATVTIAHSKTRESPGGVPARRSHVRRGRPARNGAQGLDQAGRDGDRRRHHARARRGRQVAAGRRCRICRSIRGRGRDHAGAGRRRPDDDRVPARQHACARPACRPACRCRTSAGRARTSDRGRSIGLAQANIARHVPGSTPASRSFACTRVTRRDDAGSEARSIIPCRCRSRRRRPCRAPWCRTAPTSARPRGRPACDRTRPRTRCPRAPTPPGSASRSA